MRYNREREIWSKRSGVGMLGIDGMQRTIKIIRAEGS